MISSHNTSGYFGISDLHFCLNNETNNNNVSLNDSRLVIKSSGFIGINQSNPQEYLDVAGNVKASTLKSSDLTTGTLNCNIGNITGLNAGGVITNTLTLNGTNVATKLSSIDSSIANLNFSTITNFNSTNSTISNLIVGTTNVATKLSSIDTSIANLSFNPNFTNITNTNLVSTNTTISSLNVSNILSDRILTNSTSSNNYIGPIFTTSGNVGIGTVNPQSKLHVNGTIRINNSNGGGIIEGYDSSHSIYLRKGKDNTNDCLDICEYGNIRFFTNGAINSQTEKMRITSTGNVGIGLTNPSTKLTVDGEVKGLSFTNYATNV